MPSLLELVERVNKGELIESQQLEIYQDSTNAAEKFLANHAHAMLDLRRSHTYLKEALEAIDYADQKVLFQFLSVLGFLGLNDQRCEPVIRFGGAAIKRREIGLAMEAIQSGILQDHQHGGLFSRDRDNAKTIADHYDHCGQSIGWTAPGPRDWQNPQLKIGYVTTAIADDDASARMITGLSKHFDPKQTKLHVYSTEATVRREKQAFGQGPFLAGSAKRGKETIDTLGRRKVPVWFGPLDQDLAGGVRELANQIFRDQIDVLVVDAQSNDPVAAVLSGWNPAKAKLHIVRRAPVMSGDSDGAIYFDAHRYYTDKPEWQAIETPVHLLCEGVEPLVLETPVPSRSTFGIPDQSVLLATLIQDGDETVSHDFLDAIVHSLRQHPTAVLLVAGDGDTAPIKRRLEAAGLAKRGGFVGKRKDMVDFLRMSDIYLAPFPSGNTAGTLAAMAAGRPVVALAGDASDAHRAQHLLSEEAAPTNAMQFAGRLDKLIREPTLRIRTGETLKQRAGATFAMERTAHAIESLCRDAIRPAQQEQATHAQAA